ncbi:MAG: S8 family serine peptidase, partial [Saprospiraceae bacterium]|nr:S8 family serine peptidase [Saprospiraceae bacterium]
QGWDFVERDGGIYESAAHGTSVLSVMAANLPGYMIGTAPDATYFLLKTEDTGGEFPVEEANWVAGAEGADSLGVDIINASLGYTVFNDSSLGHRYAELDGRSSIGARGAAIAALKGMLVLNSAGNSGDEAWKYLGVPADAAGVIAVGAVDHAGARAAFSSFGPTADGRIKPDLMAPGEMVVVAGETGADLALSSGTSLASPLLAGAIASLWSAFPEKTAREIENAVFAFADQVDQPDTLRGFGLPDIALSWLNLSGYFYKTQPNHARNGIFAFNREAGEFSFLLLVPVSPVGLKVELQNVLGEPLRSAQVDFSFHSISRLRFSRMFELPPGFYQVVLRSEGQAIRLGGLVWR